jgi:hypothetical protein
MRPALVSIALLFCSACEEVVVLGTECPSRDGTCEKQHPPIGDENDTGMQAPDGERSDGGDDQLPPNGDLDAGRGGAMNKDGGQLDGNARDATTPPARDARPAEPVDAGPAMFPPFINPSFELVDGGHEGELTVPNPPSPPSAETAIAPWYACRRGMSVNSSVTYSVLGNSYTVTPRQGNTFLTDTFPIVALNFNGVTQDLAAPLTPGQRYAFAVDVWAQRDPVMVGEVVLELGAGDVSCVVARKIAESKPISPDGWRKACFDFIAPAPLNPFSSTVMFVINVPNDWLNLAPVHFDNIRPDPECGNVLTP